MATPIVVARDNDTLSRQVLGDQAVDTVLKACRGLLIVIRTKRYVTSQTK